MKSLMVFAVALAWLGSLPVAGVLGDSTYQGTAAHWNHGDKGVSGASGRSEMILRDMDAQGFSAGRKGAGALVDGFETPSSGRPGMMPPGARARRNAGEMTITRATLSAGTSGDFIVDFDFSGMQESGLRGGRVCGYSDIAYPAESSNFVVVAGALYRDGSAYIDSLSNGTFVSFSAFAWRSANSWEFSGLGASLGFEGEDRDFKSVLRLSAVASQ